MTIESETIVQELYAISPVDGRYGEKTEPLTQSMSEYGLIKARIFVELQYLLALSDEPGIPLTLTSDELAVIEQLKKVSAEDAVIVKLIETTDYSGRKKTNHDVKAIEYYLADRLTEAGCGRLVPWVHFLLTSEDVNSSAYALMLRAALEGCIFEQLSEIQRQVLQRARDYQHIPMLARTHGQPATPTSLGKEFDIFSSRLHRQLIQLSSFRMLVKFGGASGNMNAHRAAYPKVDWVRFAYMFVQRLNENRDCLLKFDLNPATTQIEPHDTFAELFAILQRANVILIDFCQDIWRYISDDWLVQTPSGIGSSAMPHKVNPIDFENAEGNLGVANALLEHFSRKLPISRLQRDLSDSTVIRYFGTAFGAALVAYLAIQRGLKKIFPNEKKIYDALEAHPEVLAEAYQSILRREGHADAYTRLMAATQGKAVTLKDLHELVWGLDVSQDVKDEMISLTPQTYTGYATQVLGA